MSFIENSVCLAEIAKHTKQTAAAVEAEAHALYLFVGEDWAGRPAVSAADAHALASGAARREADHRARWADHQEATQRWEAERQAVWNRACADVRAKARRRGTPDNAAAAEAQEVAADAVEKFEKDNPAPTFDGATTAVSWFGNVTRRFKVAVR